MHVIVAQIESRFDTAARPSFAQEKLAGKQLIEDDRRTADTNQRRALELNPVCQQYILGFYEPINNIASSESKQRRFFGDIADLSPRALRRAILPRVYLSLFRRLRKRFTVKSR